MSFNLESPPMSGNASDITRYLYKLTEQLNYALNNIDDSNLTENAKDMIQAGNQTKIVMTELDEKQRESLSKYTNYLLTEIVKSATTTAQDTQTSITEMEDSIKSAVASLYVAKTEGDDTNTVADLKNYVSSLVSQTDNAVRMDFNQSVQTLTETAEGLQEFMLDTQTYIRFSEAGIEIGKKENNADVPYSVLISNDKMSFLANGVEVAYVQYNKMYITQAEVTNRLAIGTQTDGYIDIITTSAGIGFKWRGGN